MWTTGHNSGMGGYCGEHSVGVSTDGLYSPRNNETLDMMAGRESDVNSNSVEFSEEKGNRSDEWENVVRGSRSTKAAQVEQTVRRRTRKQDA